MKLCILFAVLCFSIMALTSENVYVRAGATGNDSGTDWQNALPELPWRYEWVRGNTYYIADGSYSAGSSGYIELRTAASGADYIIVKKATQGDHGTDTGWNSAYGDGTAEFTDRIQIFTSNWILDGAHGIWDGSEIPYGFKVYNNAAVTNHYLVSLVGDIENVTIQHMEMAQAGVGLAEKQVCFRASGTAPNIATNWVLRYNYMHDVSQVQLYANGCTDAIVEYNYFAMRSPGIYDTHGEAISWNNAGTNANVHIRYNIFKDIEGTGVVVIKDSVQSHFYIYGNLFYNTIPEYVLGNGSISNTTGDTNTHMYVFNNTFAYLNESTGIYWDNGADNYTYNNIWFSCDRVIFTGNNFHDYNSFYNNNSITNETEDNMIVGTSDPFTNSGLKDFTLISDTDRGTDLSGYNSLDPSFATFHIDLAGNERANWNRGAYEFDTGGAPSELNRPKSIKLE